MRRERKNFQRLQKQFSSCLPSSSLTFKECLFYLAEASSNISLIGALFYTEGHFLGDVLEGRQNKKTIWQSSPLSHLIEKGHGKMETQQDFFFKEVQETI